MAADDRHHTCHAYACNSNVPPAMFMCRKHWRMIPKALQSALWAEYEYGQEDTLTPSVAYCNVAARIVRLVAQKEGHDDETVRADPAVAGYQAFIDLGLAH